MLVLANQLELSLMQQIPIFNPSPTKPIFNSTYNMINYLARSGDVVKVYILVRRMSEEASWVQIARPKIETAIEGKDNVDPLSFWR